MTGVALQFYLFVELVYLLHIDDPPALVYCIAIVLFYNSMKFVGSMGIEFGPPSERRVLRANKALLRRKSC